MKLQQRNALGKTVRRSGSARDWANTRTADRNTALPQAAAYADLAELRTRAGDQLNELSGTLMRTMSVQDHQQPGVSAGDPVTAVLQERIALLGQLAAGLAAMVEPDAIPVTGAGYGSTVIGEELFSGRRHEYTLMLGSLVDIEAGQVSLASPIGQALLGREVGDVVEIELPYRRLRLRIVSVRTISDLLEDEERAAANV